MAMDDATNLVSELLGKLSELEQKVEHHRQDMALEFQRYSQNLLQSVPGDVSAKVEKAIKDSICNYPALCPVLDSDNPIRNESPKSHMDNDGDTKAASDNSKRRRGKERSPPPLLPHTSGTPPENEAAPRSPHEREREFQGLFTPSYLPLLDGRDSSKSSPAPAPALPTALLLSPDQTGELTKDSAKVEQPASPPAITTPRPDAVRRPTEDTISSNTSDDSTGKHPRRSALRRSSSSSIKIQSPRRVRFEVEGGEVFPTASPPLSPRVTEHTLSPLANATNLMNSSHDSETAGIGTEDEEGGELLGSSPPLPKKVTSTDRLKALARNSTEDTSKWAMVGNLQDMDEDEEMLVMGGRKRPNSSAHAANAGAAGNSISMSESSTAIAEHVEDVKATDEPVDPYEDENDELLEMPALTSFKSRKRFSPPRPNISSQGSPKASQITPTPKKPTQEAVPKAPQPTQKDSVPTAFDDEDDELFDWDPDEGDEDGAKRNKGAQDSKLPPKYIPEIDDEEVDDADVTASDAQEPEVTSKFSTSPGIPITRNLPPSASLPSRHIKEAVGSYNGRPFTISSVKDQSILEKAAKMGNLYSFVGSVDGRSGVDESASYRPDLATFTGTPKSFSQRLMMEEFEEARRQSPTNGIP